MDEIVGTPYSLMIYQDKTYTKSTRSVQYIPLKGSLSVF